MIPPFKFQQRKKQNSQKFDAIDFSRGMTQREPSGQEGVSLRWLRSQTTEGDTLSEWTEAS